MNIGLNWQADCPKCVASKFTCDEHYRVGVGMTHSVTQEVECRQCDGEGFTRTNEWPFGPTCTACNGEGWRAMTPDEEADAAERQEQERIHGEPPVTMDEMHRAAWDQKQDLRR